MIGSQRTALAKPAKNLARIVFAGAVIGPCAIGLAAPAFASPCDPFTLSMTPQPQLSCPGPDAPPPAEPTPAAPDGANALASGPPTGYGPISSGPAPPQVPGQAPYVPPVNPDGNQNTGQLSYLRSLWHEFHNGVPSDLLYGPSDGAPGTPIAPLPPGAPPPPGMPGAPTSGVALDPGTTLAPAPSPAPATPVPPIP
jgi:hypothetical protein